MRSTLRRAPGACGRQSAIQPQPAGRPLSTSSAAHFQSSLGFDFSRVRIHADDHSDAITRRHGAHAIAIGNDVLFARGKHDPGSSEGRVLLAHELTHVVQQERSGRVWPAFQDAGTWIDDRDGGLWYRTRSDAERRLRALQTLGDFREFQIQEFQHEGEVRFRVQMRGRVAQGERAQQEREAEHSSERERRSDAGTRDARAGSESARGDEPAGGRRVCLTFDDGPQNGTGDVLDVLQANSAPATFFLAAGNMAAEPQAQFDLVRRMLQNPLFQVANHTYSHDPVTRPGYSRAYGRIDQSREQQRTFDENYASNQRHFATAFSARGQTFPGFSLARLPGEGRNFPALVRRTEQLGMRHVSWSFEFAPNGEFAWVPHPNWQGVSGVSASSATPPRPSAIALFHDRHWAGANRSLLDNAVRRLAALGFTFGQLDQNGQCGAFQPQPRPPAQSAAQPDSESQIVPTVDHAASLADSS